MAEQSVIVWDLETVPDLAAGARMLDMGDATDADVRYALGSGFPKHPLHKIVCIGALVASRQAVECGRLLAAVVNNADAAPLDRGGASSSRFSAERQQRGRWRRASHPDSGHVAVSHRSATKSADVRRGAAVGGELRQAAGAAA
jgi:hypothetical protein